MIYFLKHLKGIAFFLAMLILLQSCIAVYKKASVYEASVYDNWRIKITTVDGEKYTLPWVEEKNGNVVSTKNTERIFIEKNKVKQIVKYSPEPVVIQLDSVSSFSGTVAILTKEDGGKHESHEFIKFEEQGDSYRCYRMTSKDTVTVVIPLEQVEKITVVNNGASIGVSFLVGLGVFAGIMALVYAEHGIGL